MKKDYYNVVKDQSYQKSIKNLMRDIDEKYFYITI